MQLNAKEIRFQVMTTSQAIVALARSSTLSCKIRDAIDREDVAGLSKVHKKKNIKIY